MLNARARRELAITAQITPEEEIQVDAGMNVVWNGASWDPMAPMITMTGITNEEIDALFA